MMMMDVVVVVVVAITALGVGSGCKQLHGFLQCAKVIYHECNAR